MLITNVSLRPPRAGIAAITADILETTAATDATTIGNIVFATLVDDPANVLDIVDAYSGEIMLVEASGAAVADATIPATYAAAVAEAATASDTPSATVGAVAWSPSDLGAALRAWYKFDALTGANNSAQPTVADSSGNGFTLSQATSGNQPLLAVADQNGKNALTWNGSTTYYPLPNAILSGQAAGSAYVVIKLPFDFVSAPLMDWGTSASESEWPYQDGGFYLDFGSTVRNTCGTRTGTSTVYRIYSIYSAANDWALYVDGGTGGSAGGTSPFFSTTTNTVAWRATVDLGRGHNAGIMQASLGELIFTNAKQTTADRQRMEGYLAWKWGLTGNLSSSHPYKTAPP